MSGRPSREPARPSWIDRLGQAAERLPGPTLVYYLVAGQVVAAPRWQNPSIELVTVRAVHDAKDIAFLIEWDDPFKDISITLFGSDGTDLYTLNYLECFLMSYTLGALNADEENEELRETVEISVGYSDNLLNA